MSARKFQQVNLSHDIKCNSIVDQITLLIKKIKSGNFTESDYSLCKKLTEYLQNFISKFSDIDEFDRWVATETIEMSKYTCEKYDRSPSNDKI